MRAVAFLLVLLPLLVMAVGTRAETGSDEAALLAKYKPPPAVVVDPGDKEKAALGKTLFFDPILSGASSRSCASCHNPGLSWGDGRPKAVGDSGDVMQLRAPTLLDVYQLVRFGWDGKFRDIQAVTFAAMTSPANMNLPEPEALARLAHIPGYATAFNAAFPGQGITRSTVEDAITAYEKTIVSGTAPFDRWVAGDGQAIDASAQRGFALFNGKAHCSSCHSGWAFTDGSFHDIGSAKGDDIGRGALFPTSVKLRYAFKTPTLRDVARRGPYMHDGSVPDLAAVIALYNKGGIDRPSRDELIVPLGLSERDQVDLITFLKTLTESPEPVAIPILPR
ncbi:MAG TPA: cytochrome c peroxidase [Rhodopila sp.]